MRFDDEEATLYLTGEDIDLKSKTPYPLWLIDLCFSYNGKAKRIIIEGVEDDR